MPTVKGTKTTQGSVTPSPLRRSARKTRSSEPFDPSTDVSEQPSPAVQKHSSTLHHDLIDAPTASTDNDATVEVVEDEVVVVPDPVNPHVSESYSKLQLH